MTTETVTGRAVVALELYGDPTGRPDIDEILATVTFDGDAWTATDDDGRYVTAGYRTRPQALRALAYEHLRATRPKPIRPRVPGEQ